MPNRMPTLATLNALQRRAVKLATVADVVTLRRAGAGGLEDCYQATCTHLGFDPLESRS